MPNAPRARPPSRTRSPRPEAPRPASVPPARLAPPDSLRPPLRGAQEVNARCLQMLIQSARSEKDDSIGLVAELRDLFRNLDPAMLERAARQAFLLVDMEFRDGDLWHPARIRADRRMRSPPWAGAFPRPAAIQLARATLFHAWMSLRTDPLTAPVLLGMTPPVAEVVGNLTLEEIERIAQTRFRHVHPRWDDRIAVWRRLLIAAQTGDEELMREFHLHAVQLLTGEFVAP
jgi:hypothetical protein